MMNALALAAYSMGPPWLLVAVIILFAGYPVLTLGTIVLVMQRISRGPSRRLRNCAIGALVLGLILTGLFLLIYRPWNSPQRVAPVDWWLFAGWASAMLAAALVWRSSKSTAAG